MKQNSSTEKSKSRGFTLVELIVVIAILAILAAVAYPVYTGYIKKANEAADQVLLGAVNEAFASALIDEGFYDGFPANSTFSLGTDTVSIGTSGRVYLADDPDERTLPDLTDSDSLNSAFSNYFSGNENSKFKAFVSLLYSPSGFSGLLSDGRIKTTSGMTIYPPEEKNGKTTVRVVMANGEEFTYALDNAGKADFLNSSFGKNMSMGDLIGEVNNVVNAAKRMPKAMLNTATLKEILGADMVEYLEGKGYDVNSDEFRDEAINAIVLSVANKAETWTAEGVMEALQTKDFTSLGIPGSGMGQMLPVAAISYGILGAYANSDRAGDMLTVTIDGKQENLTVAEYYKSVSEILSDPDIDAMTAYTNVLGITMNIAGVANQDTVQDYLENGGNNDLKGYLAAMGAIRDNTDSFTSSGGLEKGFGDSDLLDILNSLYGNGS